MFVSNAIRACSGGFVKRAEDDSPRSNHQAKQYNRNIIVNRENIVRKSKIINCDRSLLMVGKIVSSHACQMRWAGLMVRMKDGPLSKRAEPKKQ